MTKKKPHENSQQKDCEWQKVINGIEASRRRHAMRRQEGAAADVKYCFALSQRN